MVTCTTEKELGEALKNNEDEIEIKGSLADKTITIKGKGKVAWALAFGALSIGVAAVIVAIPSGGGAVAAGLVAAPVAVSVLGVSVASAAISIAVAAGGVTALNKLRNYKIVEHSENRLVIKR